MGWGDWQTWVLLGVCAFAVLVALFAPREPLLEEIEEPWAP